MGMNLDSHIGECYIILNADSLQAECSEWAPTTASAAFLFSPESRNFSIGFVLSAPIVLGEMKLEFVICPAIRSIWDEGGLVKLHILRGVIYEMKNEFTEKRKFYIWR